uniref:Uncharacterized protein n=1 Tax=viral metagenome TaxID=1070528 RepID=A0A6M3LS87_9ZZZZ
MAKDRLLSPNGGNSEIYIIIQKMKLLLPNGSDNSPFQRALSAEKLLSFLDRVFSSKAVGEVFVYLLDRKACTAWLLQIHLNMPEVTTYRALKRLRSLGVLEKVMRIKKPVKSAGGPRPTVWAILGASREDIASVIGEHNRSLSPKYRVAEEIVQAMMKDFLSIRVKQEITRKEIHFVLNEFKMPYRKYDVQLFVEQIFKAKGIKVW